MLLNVINCVYGYYEIERTYNIIYYWMPFFCFDELAMLYCFDAWMNDKTKNP
jgi:hypothetical protein